MTHKMNYFITGIGTNVGKTIVAAVVVEALQADYWKPVQSGELNYTDAQRVKNLITNNKSRFFEEVYKFTQPLSPHVAAKIDGVEIDFDQFILPPTENHLVVEGAGGLMVPLNENYLILDLIEKLQLNVILVSKNYLGSINHTLMTAEILKMRQIPVKGLIFSGVENPESESYIAAYANLNILGRIEYEEVMSKTFIKRNADKLRPALLSQKSNH